MALNARAAMPARTRRWHARGAEWTGDTLQALRKAHRQGYTDIDQNIQWVNTNNRDLSRGGDAFVMHWRDPKRNNYRFILTADGKRVRKMSRSELRRPVTKWTVAGVDRWRRTKHRGGVKPHRYSLHARTAARLGIRINAELKSAAFSRNIPARTIVRAAVNAGHPPWFMALWYLPRCKQKCAAIIGAGGQYAIIRNGKIGKAVVRLRVRSWRVKPTRFW